MPSKYISGTLVSGYTLSGVYSSLTIGTLGMIGGVGLVGGATQAYTIFNLGSVTGGITLQAGGTVTNGSADVTTARIVGGSGTQGGYGGVGPGGNYGYGGAGGAGGAGVGLSGGGDIGNTGTIDGGQGGTGGANFFLGGTGGSGGAGVSLSGGGGIGNAGTIGGGQGGTGGSGGGGTGGAGGSGGVGIDLSGGGSISNTGAVGGGQGGAGDAVSAGAAGGSGGAGINLSGVGSIGNTGTIAGGSGAAGVYGYDGGGAGGSGGAGITLSGGGTVDNAGTIIGGQGGAGGQGGVGTNAGGSGPEGTAGVGIVLSAGGSVSNGSLGAGTALIAGAIGIQGVGAAGASVTNYGTIIGFGGTAVSFGGSGANLLALGSGYQLSGTVQGSTAAGATNTLKLLGAAGVDLTVNYNLLGLTNFQHVLFGTGGNATLLVSNTGILPVTVSGFDATGEIIDLTEVGADGTITNSDTATDRVTVTGSLGSVTLQFDSIDGTNFTTVSDGGSGTELIACFCRGTLILTEPGEVPVEDLAIGDRVVTQSGEARPIKWIGKRAYDSRFVADNRAILPIRVEAGALADGVPARDLLLSPEHALYLDGLLLPVHLLVNGATIQQVEEIDRLEYFHIELDTHDVIFADGAAAETFVDCNNRGMFQNSHEFTTLYPNDIPAPWQFCALRAEPGSAELAWVWAGLLARAEDLGRVGRDPDLHLIVEGAVIRAHSIEGGTYRFAVPAGARDVIIASRSVVPGKAEAASLDWRRLGVALEQIVLRGVGMRIDIGPDCPKLRDGYHRNEGMHRWTDGRGSLPPTFSACFDGDFSIEVQVAETGLHYPTQCGLPRQRSARMAMPSPGDMIRVSSV